MNQEVVTYLNRNNAKLPRIVPLLDLNQAVSNQHLYRRCHRFEQSLLCLYG